jgi:hypothetical protein
LFGFCLALVAYNVLAVVLAALRGVHGQQTVDAEVSLYSLANEVATTYHGMMSAIPEMEWDIFYRMSASANCLSKPKMSGVAYSSATAITRQSVKLTDCGTASNFFGAWAPATGYYEEATGRHSIPCRVSPTVFDISSKGFGLLGGTETPAGSRTQSRTREMRGGIADPID